MDPEAADVNPLTLPSLPVARRLELPDCPAIYFGLSESGEVMYVGRAVSLVARWRGTHARRAVLEATGHARISWLAVEDAEELPALEEDLIRLLRPPLNGTSLPVEREEWLPWEHSPEDAAELVGPDLDAEHNAQIAALYK